MALQRFPRGRARVFSAGDPAPRPRPDLGRAAALERLETRTFMSGATAPGQGVATAHDDVIDTDEGNAVTIPVLANDNLGGGIQFSSFRSGRSPPTGRSPASTPRTATITYKPGVQFVGTDTFTYSFRDVYGVPSNPATVTVIVNRPVANDDFAADRLGPSRGDRRGRQRLRPRRQRTPRAGERGHHLGPLHGTASADGGGTITYTPTPGFEGTDHFLYTIKDDAGATSNFGTDTIAVSAPRAARHDPERRCHRHRRGQPRYGQRAGQRLEPRRVQRVDRGGGLAAGGTAPRPSIRRPGQSLISRSIRSSAPIPSCTRSGTNRAGWPARRGCRSWSTGRRRTTISARPSARRPSRWTSWATTPTRTGAGSSTRPASAWCRSRFTAW